MEENNDKRYALILAGGNGSRLWPISTTNKPKQYLSLYSNNIMINETIKRIENLFEYDNIFVITNIEQKELAERYIDSRIPRENIIFEPISRNTAMCIFYASIIILKEKGNGTMTILSSDHYIYEPEKLLNNIEEGIKLADKGENLVTIGIKPTYPATGFGYIKYYYNNDLKCNIVKEFKEKPVYEKAKEYIESGIYYWNSGMFIWKISTILNNYEKFLPKIYRYKDQIANCIDNEKDLLKNMYENIESISIDKGILEKSNNIKMIKGDFKWMDIGNINDFFNINHTIKNTNIQKGNVITENTQRSNIYNEDEDILIATLGVENINIINSNGVILVADKEQMNELPNLISKIKQNSKFKKYI